VGIGTSSPGVKLEVAGDTRSTGVSTINQFQFAANGTGTYSNLRITNSSSTATLSVGVGGSAVGATTLQNNAYVWNTAASSLSFGTSDLERLRITNSGNVGIGTTSPASITHITGVDPALIIQDSGANNFATNQAQIQFRTATNIVGLLGYESDTDEHLSIKANGGNSAVKFFAGNAERMRIASSGNVGIGTSSPLADLDISSSGTTVAFTTYNAGNVADITSYAARPGLEFISYQSDNGSPYTKTSAIIANGDGTVPSEMQFWTKTNGQSSAAERMRITSNGDVLVGTTATGDNDTGINLQKIGTIKCAREGNIAGIFNRKTDDGVVIRILQDGAIEGTISVSGSTVSYNGGHLARWSQTADNNRIDLLKGTVMTNLDQMAVWGDEDNEQLNCMAVSSVEGDPNVAGVFVNWDDDDETYMADMNIAMTGDMIIRIGAGVTVERGDLLMSAGDGTAKPQGDDIIRSKTIAKVTSTYVTCTYEDGSYCVPCVLMAC
jgi:hypothetical protein